MNDIRKYEKMIRSMFPVYGPYEKRFYSDFRRNLSEYNLTQKDPDFSDLEKQFGKPSDIIRDYLEHADTGYLIRQLYRTKHIKTACVCVLCGIIAGLIIWNASCYHSYQVFMENLPAIEETTIEYLN